MDTSLSQYSPASSPSTSWPPDWRHWSITPLWPGRPGSRPRRWGSASLEGSTRGSLAWDTWTNMGENRQKCCMIKIAQLNTLSTRSVVNRTRLEDTGTLLCGQKYSQTHLQQGRPRHFQSKTVKINKALRTLGCDTDMWTSKYLKIDIEVLTFWH